MTCRTVATICCMLVLSTVSVFGEKADWKTALNRELPILGHRNWVVVADSAYPSQTAPGKEIEDQLDELSIDPLRAFWIRFNQVAYRIHSSDRGTSYECDRAGYHLDPDMHIR